MADLFEFINEITKNKKRYCMVCFRTEKERKLVTPVALAEFVKFSRLEKVSKKESACIYCERQAEVALKLYKTLSYARHVNEKLWFLVNKSMSPRGIAYVLPSKVRGQNASPGSVKRNKLLSLLRQFQTFTQTDVLVVDATVPNEPVDKQSEADVSILIEDDDDNPPTIPRLVPIEKLLEKPPTINPSDLNSVAVTPANLKSLVLYPVKTTDGSDHQFLIIPEGANVKIDGNSLNILNDGPTIPILLPNGNVVGVQPQNSNQIVLPITNDVIQNQYTVGLNQMSNVEEIIMSDNRKIGEKVTNSKYNILRKSLTKNVQNINIHCLPNNVQNDSNTINFANVNDPKILPKILPKICQKAPEQTGNDQICQISNVTSDQICQITDLRSEEVSDGSDMCQISNLRSLQEEVVVDVPPAPKKKADPNIDWEDKIPMDVISFMDAKDPNAPNIVAPIPPAPRKSPAPPAHTKPPANPATPTETPQPPSQTRGVMEQTMSLLTPHRSRRQQRKRKGDDDFIYVIN